MPTRTVTITLDHEAIKKIRLSAEQLDRLVEESLSEVLDGAAWWHRSAAVLARYRALPCADQQSLTGNAEGLARLRADQHDRMQALIWRFALGETTIEQEIDAIDTIRNYGGLLDIASGLLEKHLADASAV